MRPKSLLIGLVAALAVVVAACGGEDTASGSEAASGFMFIDPTEAHLCESMLESYPPQCGEPSVELFDLEPDLVVALMSPADQPVAPFFWTDYVLGVEGTTGANGLSDVVLTDPVYANESDSLVLRTVDLGPVAGEPAVWPFDLTNATDTDTMLTFTSGQKMELTLNDDDGEVYRWSEGMMFTQAIEEVALPAGATLPFVLTSEPIDLQPGTYTARAWVRAAEAMNVSLTWQVTVQG